MRASEGRRRGLIINLSRPRTRWLLGFFLIVGAIEVFLLTLGGLELLEFTDSPAFCGALCHQVMEPEYTAYKASPHARVSCVECHVGSGTNYFVRSKLTGIPLILRTITGRYERPVTTPVHSLRPARETCERCHWPEKTTPERIRLFARFAADESNTREAKLLVFRMGGGKPASGVHWHIAARLTYLPLDRARQEIGWVRVETPEGRVEEFVDPARRLEITSERIKREGRTFDCMDCHNRATHIFRSPDELLDSALSRGDLDPSLPLIKKKGLEVLNPSSQSLEEALRKADALRDFYRASYPQVYQQKPREVQKAVEALRGLARGTVFPHMRVTWETHADSLTHNGCFRCHGRLVAANPDGAGRTVPGNCTLCHYDLPPEAARVVAGGVPTSPTVTFVPHSPTQPQDCLACHATGVARTPKMPSDHAGTTNKMCLDCHQAAATPQPFSPAAPPIPHAVSGREACLVCHAQGRAGARPMPANHSGATDALCTTCHTRVPGASGGAPAVLHPTFVGEPCLLCHAEGRAGAPKTPADHTGRTNETCVACHGLTLVPLPASVPPPAVSHPTFSGEPCLLCHAEGKAGAPKAPPDHAAWTEDMCAACHRVTVAPVPASQQPPPVPHPATSGERCLTCHAEGKVGAPKVPADHAGRTNELCLACHRLLPQPTPASR